MLVTSVNGKTRGEIHTVLPCYSTVAFRSDKHFFFKMPFVAMIPVLSGPLSLLLPDSAPAAPTNKEGGLCKQLVKLLHAHNSYRNTRLSIGFFTS